MAKARTANEGTRLTHRNGATVVVDSDKAERLTAGGLFTEAKRTSSAKSSDS